MTTERQLGRAHRDEIALALLDRLANDVVTSPGDALFEFADHARSEAAVDQAAQPGVTRRVHVDHHQALLRHLILGHVEQEAGLALRGEDLRISGDENDVGVPSNRPVTLRTGRIRVVKNRGLRAQQGELIVRHTRDVIVRIEQIDLIERQSVLRRGHRIRPSDRVEHWLALESLSGTGEHRGRHPDARADNRTGSASAQDPNGSDSGLRPSPAAGYCMNSPAFTKID